MSLPSGPIALSASLEKRLPGPGYALGNKGYCFGTESGKVVFLDPSDDGKAEQADFKVSDEAINGVAFWQDLVGITTRSEVLIYSTPLSGLGALFIGGSTGGAHGIIATPRGRLLAPMDTAGLSCFDGEKASSRQGWIERPAQGVRNDYKVVYLGEWHGNEILACATRTDGLARMEIGARDANRVVSLSAPSVDLIDVCSLRSKDIRLPSLASASTAP